MTGLTDESPSSELELLGDAALPPKEKPSPKRLRPGGFCMVGTDIWPAEGIKVTGPSSPADDSSSAIEDVGKEPGRGKKTDKFREWIRACLRV